MLALALVALVAAPPAVVSPRADRIAVTLYRDPARGPDQPMDRGDPAGFALVTETRTVDLPAGRAELRFEGVAGGILPQSAVVRGLPGGTIEKDRDARLLSPGLLLDAHLGERVHLTRTDPRTGRVTEQDATVRADGDGVVIETAAGVEALGCSGLPERLSFDGVPPTLAPRPTLAVTTTSPAAGHARVTLSYLASGFDWQANYVAAVRPDGRTLDLVGWMTLANANREGFADAQLLAVAGRLNRSDTAVPSAASAPIRLSCWPRGVHIASLAPPPPPPPPPPPAPMMMRAQDIGVIGLRKEAVLEALGDLKLYRVPVPVTVAASAVKQVGLLHADGVPFAHVYRASIGADEAVGPDDPNPVAVVLRLRNVAAAGLGKPLPLGRVAVFAPAAGTRLLLAEGGVRDVAVGEDVELPGGATAQVRLVAAGDPQVAHGRLLTLTNANPVPTRVEVALRLGDGERVGGATLPTRDGQPLWAVTVPAHGTATLRYRVVAPG